MSHIPLIFTRPFQSIHFSVGNIAHTCLYVSLYALLCSVDRHFQPSPFAFPPRQSWKGVPVVVATRPCVSPLPRRERLDTKQRKMELLLHVHSSFTLN